MPVPPLRGVRVLDLTRMLAGPHCTLILGDLGAEVIKVEAPPDGDFTRTIGPPFAAGESGYFMSVNRNKQSLVLDLKQPAGREVFFDLVDVCDVLVENFRVGVTRRLGIDAEAVRARNPRLVYCSISGFGQHGPLRDFPAYDLSIQALSGGMSITGEPRGPLVKMGIPIGDLGASLYGAIGILAALQARSVSGEGRTVDVAMFDANLALLTYLAGPYFLDGETNKRPEGTGHPNIVPYRMYPTRDGQITVAFIGEGFWPILCAALGRPELADDPRFATNAARVAHREEVDRFLEEAFAAYDAEELAQTLLERGLPVAKVNTIDEALSLPHVAERAMAIVLRHPRSGPITALGNPVKMAGIEEADFAPPPLLGQHTRRILGELLHYDAARIEELEAGGVIRCAAS
ncbi:MAG: CoA transferase [Candidatus Tectomicrobia bacterium]|nr:CoA transferase [Candidatus Tectomicrobia bacterium]